MLWPGLQVSVGTTVYTSSGTKYPSTLERLHLWAFIVYCTGFPPSFPLEMYDACLCSFTGGRWEEWVLKGRNGSQGSRCAIMSEKEGGNIWHRLHCNSLNLVEDTPTCLSGFPLVSPTDVLKVSQTSLLRGPSSSSGSKSLPSSVALLSSASSLLFAVSEHLLPLQDHLVELLQAGLQALTIQRWAALCVVRRGQAHLMQSQHLLHLKHRAQNSHHLKILSHKSLQNRSFNNADWLWTFYKSCSQYHDDRNVLRGEDCTSSQQGGYFTSKISSSLWFEKLGFWRQMIYWYKAAEGYR